MTNDERQELQNRWQDVLLDAGADEQNRFATLKQIIKDAKNVISQTLPKIGEKVGDGSSLSQLTLVAVAATETTLPPTPPSAIATVSDCLIIRFDWSDNVSHTLFFHIIAGTIGSVLRRPVRVIVFGEKGNGVRGEIDQNGNWNYEAL